MQLSHVGAVTRHDKGFAASNAVEDLSPVVAQFTDGDRIHAMERITGDTLFAREGQGTVIDVPLTNPWLTGPASSRVCPRDVLEERILNLLSTHNLAVVATVAADGSPAATPVRYYSLGFEIMFTSWADSPKSRNLRRDPRVSAGIVAPLVGQASSRGAQLFGTARTLERDDAGADDYWEAFRWQSEHVERGRSLTDPPRDPLTIITAHRIV